MPSPDFADAIARIGGWIRGVFRGRPGWMNALMVFCAVMAFVYVPWDVLLKPAARDQEVWFGVMFTGWAAKAAGVLHWAVYAAGAYGFRKLRPWMWPWAALYAAQVAFGMFVWSVLHGPAGSWGWLLGGVAAIPFALLARALWRARPVFEAARPPLSRPMPAEAPVTSAQGP